MRGKSCQICILFAYQLCEPQAWPSAPESPWLGLPPLWFPHLSESLPVASCVATAGEQGVQMLATGIPRTHKGPSSPAPRLQSPRSCGVRRGLAEAWREAPGWLEASPPLGLTEPRPTEGSPAGVPRALPCPRGLVRVVPAPPPSSPSAEAGASAAVGRQRAVPSHWSQIIASCFVVWCLGPGASHLWGRAVARASLRNYPPPHRCRRRH